MHHHHHHYPPSFFRQWGVNTKSVYKLHSRIVSYPSSVARQLWKKRKRRMMAVVAPSSSALCTNQ